MRSLSARLKVTSSLVDIAEVPGDGMAMGESNSVPDS